jgi:hypothetical protein
VRSPRVRWGVDGTGGIGRRTVGDLRLCESPEVGAVYIGTSHSTQFSYAREALLAAMEQIRDRLADERDQRQQQPTKETARA